MPEMDENDEIIFTSDDVAFAEIVIGEKLREKLGPPPQEPPKTRTGLTLYHRPYVNARGEYIANGTDRELWCGWEHRPTCPLCQWMEANR